MILAGTAEDPDPDFSQPSYHEEINMILFAPHTGAIYTADYALVWDPICEIAHEG